MQKKKACSHTEKKKHALIQNKKTCSATEKEKYM